MFLLDEAEAVDDLVQVEVGVLPGLHRGLLSLETTRDKEKTLTTLKLINSSHSSDVIQSFYPELLLSHILHLPLSPGEHLEFSARLKAAPERVGSSLHNPDWLMFWDQILTCNGHLSVKLLIHWWEKQPRHSSAVIMWVMPLSRGEERPLTELLITCHPRSSGAEAHVVTGCSIDSGALGKVCWRERVFMWHKESVRVRAAINRCEMNIQTSTCVTVWLRASCRTGEMKRATGGRVRKDHAEKRMERISKREREMEKR